MGPQRESYMKCFGGRPLGQRTNDRHDSDLAGRALGCNRTRSCSGSAGLQVLVAAVISILVMGVVAFIAIRYRSAQSARASEILLEAADVEGSDPFVPLAAQTSPQSKGSPPGAPSASPKSAGTGDIKACDVEQLIAYLKANPSQAAAWTEALNADPTLRWAGGTRVEVSQLASYIRDLTPKALEQDLRVTNHRFTDGRPVPVQSVLQKGTASLIDKEGVPRVRCKCGNPLVPKRVIPATPKYTGKPWPAIKVVVINRSDDKEGKKYCDKYRDDDECKKERKKYCEEHGDDDWCKEQRKKRCEEHGDDDWCKEQRRKYCEEHGDDDKCQDLKPGGERQPATSEPCSDGEQRVGDQCEPTAPPQAIECQSDQQLVDGVCQPTVEQATQEEAARQTAQQEAAQQEAARQPAQQEAAQQEAAQQEVTQQEAARQTAQQEAAQEEVTQEEEAARQQQQCDDANGNGVCDSQEG
jgi:hypothetical protein